MTKAGWIAATLFMASAITIQAHAADVKIGVIYPLTGNAASAGQSAKDAVELGVEIVNRGYPELKAMPLGATAGLPNLGGAKIVLVQADHQGNPQVGQQQTLRLITQDQVVAMLGSYHSSVSLVATAAAERQGIPFLVADSVALNITDPRIQVDLPQRADRARLCQGLHRISHRFEEVGQEDRHYRYRQ